MSIPKIQTSFKYSAATPTTTASAVPGKTNGNARPALKHQPKAADSMEQGSEGTSSPDTQTNPANQKSSNKNDSENDSSVHAVDPEAGR